MTDNLRPRRPSPLQRSILIALAVLDVRLPGPVATRDIERLLEQGGGKPVYGPNLRASCRRMEAAGWLRTLRAPNLQLAVELTDAGRDVAVPLLIAEREADNARRRSEDVFVLPAAEVSSTEVRADRLVKLDGSWYTAWRADFVMRLDTGTCLQLWNAAGQLIRLTGDPLQVAQWLQTCHIAGIEIRLQINESHTPEEGCITGAIPADQTETWYRQLDAELQELGISGLTETERQAVMAPGETLRSLPAPARLLAVLQAREETAYPLSTEHYEDDTGPSLADALTSLGFTQEQVWTLSRLVRWPLMDKDELERREQSDLIALLDALEQRQLFCHRERLITLIFSPVRKPGESWTERLRWLLGDGMADGFGFRSPLSREDDRALDYLAGWLGREGADRLATTVQWTNSSV